MRRHGASCHPQACGSLSPPFGFRSLTHF
jgi:hypothetical protein